MAILRRFRCPEGLGSGWGVSEAVEGFVTTFAGTCLNLLRQLHKRTAAVEWKYYLLSSAGAFRYKAIRDCQILLSPSA